MGRWAAPVVQPHVTFAEQACPRPPTGSQVRRRLLLRTRMGPVKVVEEWCYLEQGEPRLTQVVDDDANLLPITGSSWDGRRMHWKYQDVVSGDTVEAEVQQFARDRLVGEWIATAADGSVNRGSHTWSRIDDDEP